MAEVPDPRRQKWVPYFRKIGDMLGLKDWILEIGNDEPSDRSAMASAHCVPGRKSGWFRLSQNFLECTAEEQRMMVLHELVHCHFEMSFSMASDHMAEDKRAIFRTLTEYGIDGISVALAPLFPLPGNEIRS
jgi:hypothetical protein